MTECKDQMCTTHWAKRTNYCDLTARKLTKMEGIMTRQSIYLEVPADTSFVGIVRTATLGFASRLEFPIDQLDELSHAAHEMAALLLSDTGPEGQLNVELHELNPTTVQVVAKSRTNRGIVPRTDTFAWTILNALVDHVEAQTDGGIVIITATRSIQPHNTDPDGPPNSSAPGGQSGAAGNHAGAAL